MTDAKPWLARAAMAGIVAGWCACISVPARPEFGTRDGGASDGGLPDASPLEDPVLKCMPSCTFRSGGAFNSYLQCTPSCTFPPGDDFDIDLLPPQRVDTAYERDLVIGNHPETASSSWGFFVIRNIDTQTGTLQTALFVRTTIRPLAVRAESISIPDSFRVFVFGDVDGTGTSAQLQIFEVDTGADPVTVAPITQTAPQSMPLAADGRALMSTGQFAGEPYKDLPDIALVTDDKLYTLLCNQESKCPSTFTQATIYDANDNVISSPLPTSGVRFLGRRNAAFPSPFRSIHGTSNDDLVIAGDGALRWLSYSTADRSDGGAYGPRWRSVAPANLDNVGDSLANLTGGLSMDLGSGGRRAVILGQTDSLVAITIDVASSSIMAAGPLMSTSISMSVQAIANDLGPLWVAVPNTVTTTGVHALWPTFNVSAMSFSASKDTSQAVPLDPDTVTGIVLFEVAGANITERALIMDSSGNCAFFDADLGNQTQTLYTGLQCYQP